MGNSRVPWVHDYDWKGKHTFLHTNMRSSEAIVQPKIPGRQQTQELDLLQKLLSLTSEGGHMPGNINKSEYDECPEHLNHGIIMIVINLKTRTTTLYIATRYKHRLHMLITCMRIPTKETLSRFNLPSYQLVLLSRPNAQVSSYLSFWFFSLIKFESFSPWTSTFWACLRKTLFTCKWSLTPLIVEGHTHTLKLNNAHPCPVQDSMWMVQLEQ